MRVRCHMISVLGLVVVFGALALAGCGRGGALPTRSGVTSSAASSAVSGGVAPQVAAPAASPGQPSSTSSSGTTAAPASWDRKIVRNAQLTLTVSDVEQELTFVRTTTTTYGGQVITSSTSYDGSRQLATVGIEVPSNQFDSVMNTLRGGPLVKKVEQETTTSQDVTDQYVDLQAELKNDQATLQRYLTLQQQATTMQDVLAIEQQISRVQGEIEQLQGRINYLDHTTSYSQINLTLQPVGAPAPAPTPTFDLAHAVQAAWAASIGFVGRALSAVVTVVVFLWWLWLLAAAGWGAYVLVRSRRSGSAPPSGAA